MPVGVYAPNSSTGNGVTTVFPYSFRIIDQTHLVVTVDGVEMALTTDYTVDGVGNSNGGNVTMLVAPANGTVVLRYRDVPYTREEDYQSNGDLREETLDDDIDLREMQIQQIAEAIVRAIVAPIGSGFSGLLPSAVGHALYVLGPTATENGIEYVDPGSVALAIPADGSVTPVKLAAGTRGDILYAGAAGAWAKLAAGTAGRLLQTNGAGADPTWAGFGLPSQTNNGGKVLSTDGTNAAWINSDPCVRQTVLSGTVDANGLPNFGGATGGTTVTQANTLVATAANGNNIYGGLNRNGLKVNPSWTGLNVNGTMYLGVTVNADGSLTEFSTTLAPTYRWGGADVVTANQRTFNIQEMQMKVGNGATAAQAYDVFVGEVTVAGAVVTAITWYALMGRYTAPWTATLPAAAAAVSYNHNIGSNLLKCLFEIENTTTEAGYAVGDQIQNPQGAGNGVIYAPWSTRLTGGVTLVSSAGIGLQTKSTGVIATATLASWKYRMRFERGW